MQGDRDAYDPSYDPILDSGPGQNRDYAPTYWIDTAGAPPADDGPVTGDLSAETVVIGSGYTGLSTAIHLARDHGLEAMVLEANAVAWGCSTRNGGQAQISSGRLRRSQWIARWGLEVAKKLHGELVEAFSVFEDLIASDGIDCAPQTGGHFYIAHKEAVLPALHAEAELLRNTFGYAARIIPGPELRASHVNDREAHGAMWEPDGTAIHAAKLAFGYLRMARRLGVRVHTGSPVIEIEKRGSLYHLRTPAGVVRAKRVAIATAGYTPGRMHGLTRNRLLPVLSHSVVTRVLSAAELADCGIRTGSPLTDTRTLRNYYRLLPDNRVQFGSRSSITGRDAHRLKHLDLLTQGLARKFPALGGIDLDYSWWGWVDVSHDMMPRIVQPDPSEDIFYAMGYGGNGVMYSAQAGRRMAQLVAGRGKDVPDLPIFRGELPHYGAFTPFRRIGQRWLYHWYHFKDERA